MLLKNKRLKGFLLAISQHREHAHQQQQKHCAQRPRFAAVFLFHNAADEQMEALNAKNPPAEPMDSLIKLASYQH